MKINIENLVRHCGAESHYQYTLECLVGHLKILKEKGDADTLKDFFELYVFDSNQDKS